jgi:hypothetical protein
MVCDVKGLYGWGRLVSPRLFSARLCGEWVAPDPRVVPFNGYRQSHLSTGFNSQTSLAF